MPFRIGVSFCAEIRVAPLGLAAARVFLIPGRHAEILEARQRYAGVYTEKGVPTCLGLVPMEYVRSDSERGHLYRCRQEGCHLKARKGVRHCDYEIWENRSDNPRLFGPLRQKSPEWRALYWLRQSVERLFKTLKESRRLERHHIRGLRRVGLHVAMSALGFAATYLVNVLAGSARPRWMVRKVA